MTHNKTTSFEVDCLPVSSGILEIPLKLDFVRSMRESNPRCPRMNPGSLTTSLIPLDG